MRTTYGPVAMTQAIWDQYTRAEKDAARDLSGLNPQLIGLEGSRIEVTDAYGERRRFWVSRSTGWRPCHLEIRRRGNWGGDVATGPYKDIRVVDRGPF
jgi:hypothetical protein